LAGGAGGAAGVPAGAVWGGRLLVPVAPPHHPDLVLDVQRSTGPGRPAVAAGGRGHLPVVPVRPRRGQGGGGPPPGRPPVPPAGLPCGSPGGPVPWAAGR